MLHQLIVRENDENKNGASGSVLFFVTWILCNIYGKENMEEDYDISWGYVAFSPSFSGL